MFPLAVDRRSVRGVNRRLSETQIRATCRELLGSRRRVSGRALCAELRARFGAVGKTTRVFAIWREELTQAAVPPSQAQAAREIAELQRRLAAAETAAAENLARAQRAEFREEKHQETWAMEVDRLRLELQTARPPVKKMLVI